MTTVSTVTRDENDGDDETDDDDDDDGDSMMTTASVCESLSQVTKFVCTTSVSLSRTSVNDACKCLKSVCKQLVNWGGEENFQ